MLEAQQQAEKLLTKEYLQTQHTQVAMTKEVVERRQMLVSIIKVSILSLYCFARSGMLRIRISIQDTLS